MATQTLYTTGTTKFSKGESIKIFRMDYILDFTVASVTNGDVLKLIALPAGAYVLGVSAAVNTPATTSTTMSLGDSGSGTQWLTTEDVTVTAGTLLVPDVYTPKFYTAADYVSATIAGASPTVGKISVSVLVADMSGTAHLPAGVASL